MQEATVIWVLCALRVHETSLTGHNLWFYLVPQRPNGNNVIARVKTLDNTSFECLSLTFKNTVTICELPSYVTWRLSSQSRTPLALCISQLGKVNTGSYKLNKYSMDKQAHAMCLTVKLPRVHNVLIYVVNLQSWAVAQNTLPMSLALNISVVEYTDLKEWWPMRTAEIWNQSWRSPNSVTCCGHL